MRVTTLVIIIALIGGGLWYAKKAGYLGKVQSATQDSFEAHLAKGKGLYQVTKYDEAIEELNKAIAASPTHEDMPRALRCLGDCHKEKREPQKAVEIYERIIKDYPDDKMRGDVEKAIEKVKALNYF